MTTSCRQDLLALAACWLGSAGAFAAPQEQQNELEGLGVADGDAWTERRWALNVHVIGASGLDVSGDFEQTAIDGDDASLDGWGIEGSTLGDRFTFLLGFEERTLEQDVDFLEVYGGSKLNIWQTGPWSPYLIGTLRYSQDLEFPTTPSTASDDFFGWSAGGGVVYNATDRFFLEARVVYEGLFDDIDARMGREVNFQGPVATFGAGFTF